MKGRHWFSIFRRNHQRKIKRQLEPLWVSGPVETTEDEALLCEIIPGLYTCGSLRRFKRPDSLVRKLEIDLIVAMNTPPTKKIARLVNYACCLIRDGDLTHDDLERVLSMASLVVGVLKDHKNVIVHCAQGRNRSCFLSAIVVAMLKDISGMTAMRWVQRVRKGSIRNPHFRAFLENYEASKQ